MSQNSNFPPPYTAIDVVQAYEQNRVQVRRLGHTSCDYRRSHIEVWVCPLDAGESVCNIPMIADAQGTIRGIRVRSKSDKIKFTVTSAPIYEVGADLHPRSIVYQDTVTEPDTIFDFENLYVYLFDNQEEVKTFVSIENQGSDSGGVSIVFTFGY